MITYFAPSVEICTPTIRSLTVLFAAGVDSNNWCFGREDFTYSARELDAVNAKINTSLRIALKVNLT